jgi:hypothetical protein
MFASPIRDGLAAASSTSARAPLPQVRGRGVIPVGEQGTRCDELAALHADGERRRLSWSDTRRQASDAPFPPPSPLSDEAEHVPGLAQEPCGPRPQRVVACVASEKEADADGPGVIGKPLNGLGLDFQRPGAARSRRSTAMRNCLSNSNLRAPLQLRGLRISPQNSLQRWKARFCVWHLVENAMPSNEGWGLKRQGWTAKPH